MTTTTATRQVRLLPEFNPVTQSMISIGAEEIVTNSTLGRWYVETQEGWLSDGQNFTTFAAWAEAAVQA